MPKKLQRINPDAILIWVEGEICHMSGAIKRGIRWEYSTSPDFPRADLPAFLVNCKAKGMSVLDMRESAAAAFQSHPTLRELPPDFARTYTPILIANRGVSMELAGQFAQNVIAALAQKFSGSSP